MLIPNQKNIELIVDEIDYERVVCFRWTVVKKGNSWYAKRVIDNKVENRTIYLHRFILNVEEAVIVDHIDGNGLNNSRKNLRICSIAENTRNQKLKRNNTSGYKGVYLDKKSKTNPWKAQITFKRKVKGLGRFSNSLDAAKAYDKEALILFGPFALLNIEGIQ